MKSWILGLIFLSAQAFSLQNTIFDSYGFSKIDIESIYMGDGRDSILKYKGALAYETGKSIVGIYSDRHAGVICTGSVVGPNLIMTNHHCLQDCNTTSAAFFYETANNYGKQMRCVKSYPSYEGYDYWFFEVDSIPQGVQQLKLVNSNVYVGQVLWMIGHPRGGPKAIDNSVECRVNKINLGDVYDRLDNFTHQCDTEGGNSGSPVLDRASQMVVGLHWGAGATTTDPDSGNHAIPIHRVLDHVYKNQPALYSKINKY